MPAVRKTACIAYRGLVPMSPNTTPRAPRVSAPSPAAPACFAVTPGFEGRPTSEPGSVADAEPSESTPVGVLPAIALAPLARSLRRSRAGCAGAISPDLRLTLTRDADEALAGRPSLSLQTDSDRLRKRPHYCVGHREGRFPQPQPEELVIGAVAVESFRGALGIPGSRCS